MQYQRFLFTLGHRLAISLLLLTFGVATAAAQDVDDVVRTQTSLVQLNVGVVDGKGHPVTSLTKGDFVIYEDGVKQTIQLFEPAEAPFSLVLMLDMSGSTLNFRQQLKLASQRFLDVLRPEDRVAVVQFNAKVKSLSGFSGGPAQNGLRDRACERRGRNTFLRSVEVCVERVGEGRQATQSDRRAY